MQTKWPNVLDEWIQSAEIEEIDVLIDRLEEVLAEKHLSEEERRRREQDVLRRRGIRTRKERSDKGQPRKRRKAREPIALSCGDPCETRNCPIHASRRNP